MDGQRRNGTATPTTVKVRSRLNRSVWWRRLARIPSCVIFVLCVTASVLLYVGPARWRRDVPDAPLTLALPYEATSRDAKTKVTSHNEVDARMQRVLDDMRHLETATSATKPTSTAKPPWDEDEVTAAKTTPKTSRTTTSKAVVESVECDRHGRFHVAPSSRLTPCVITFHLHHGESTVFRSIGHADIASVDADDDFDGVAVSRLLTFNDAAADDRCETTIRPRWLTSRTPALHSVVVKLTRLVSRRRQRNRNAKAYTLTLSPGLAVEGMPANELLDANFLPEDADLKECVVTSDTAYSTSVSIERDLRYCRLNLARIKKGDATTWSVRRWDVTLDVVALFQSNRCGRTVNAEVEAVDWSAGGEGDLILNANRREFDLMSTHGRLTDWTFADDTTDDATEKFTAFLIKRTGVVDGEVAASFAGRQADQLRFSGLTD